jgi:hypothetical protein
VAWPDHNTKLTTTPFGGASWTIICEATQDQTVNRPNRPMRFYFQKLKNEYGEIRYRIGSYTELSAENYQWNDRPMTIPEDDFKALMKKAGECGCI